MGKKYYYFFFIFTLSALIFLCNVYASILPGDTTRISKDVMKNIHEIQIPFIANEGQINKDISFYAKTFGGTLYVTRKGEMVYSLPKISNLKTTHSVKKAVGDKKIEICVLKESLLGTNNINPQGENKAKTQISYFIGNDKERWKSNIHTYNNLSLGRVYDGIDFSLKAYGKNVEKIFTVYPQGKVSDIRLKIDGASSLQSNLNGELEIETALGTVKFTAPAAYQMIDGKHKNVNAAYDVKERTYGFQVAEYDHAHPLIIDPLLASTFIGGALTDHPYAAVLDAFNNVYITGYTESLDFPTTTPLGGFIGPGIGINDPGPDHEWGYDIFVAKLSNDFTSLLAATYIGGSGANEYSHSIALDSNNKIFITGTTDSDDFPTGSQANGWSDAFICKLSNSLLHLEESKLIGGIKHDCAYSIAIKTIAGHDKIFISGFTGSPGFPTTTGAYDWEYNGGFSDVFVAKFNNLLAREESTFVGGADNEHGFAITVDSSDDVWVSGWTDSSDFPTTSGAYDEEYNSGKDVFILRLNSNLHELKAATYIGGNSDEVTNDIKVSPSGMIFITGWTDSANFPTTSGAYNESGYSSTKDVFVSKFSSDFTNLSASTYLGGTGQDEAHELAFDSSGNVYLVGYTTSQNFPTTAGAYDRILNLGWTGTDAFVSKLTSNLTELARSTFLGGIYADVGVAIALDNVDNVYIIGWTFSDDFPVTSGTYDQVRDTYEDLFVSKLNADLSSGATPPVVTSTTPAAYATGVAVDASIYARFSTAMDPATITAATFLVDDGIDNIPAVFLLYEGKTARFIPAGDLDYSHTYTVRITTDVTDVVGTPMANEYTWTFQTIILSNNPPDKPTLISPGNEATNVSLTTELQTGDFSDPDIGNTHLQTRWQVSKLLDFSLLVLDVTTLSHRTILTIPESMLEEGTTYYWRAMFYDNFGIASEWADPYHFTTVTTSNDTNPANGIPDDQEIDDTIDLDENGEADINQSDIKCVETLVGNGQICIKGSTNIVSLDTLKAIDPVLISDTINKPDNMPLGLISFKVFVNTPGDTAEVTVYLSEAAESTAGWYKHDSINGWQDFFSHATFIANRKSLTLQLKDGGFGDADGTANGIIVDPSGYNIPSVDIFPWSMFIPAMIGAGK